MNLIWSKNLFPSLKPVLPQLVGLGVFLILWQLGAMHYSSIVSPSPKETVIAFWRLTTAGKLQDALLTTSFHLLAAFTLAVLLGIILGMMAGIKFWCDILPR
ncbi:MAG: hypothetical protein AB4372_15300 [Xenococcus sp. (in: cyanobacteria)]